MIPELGAWMHLWKVIYCIPVYVTVTLNYDLVSRVVASGAYLLYYLRNGSLWCVDFSLDCGVVTWGHFDLDIDF